MGIQPANGLLFTTIIAALVWHCTILVVVSFVITGMSDAWLTYLIRYWVDTPSLSVAVDFSGHWGRHAWCPRCVDHFILSIQGRRILSWLYYFNGLSGLYPCLHLYRSIRFQWPSSHLFEGFWGTSLADEPVIEYPLITRRRDVEFGVVPYVYLLARAAFMEQSANLMEAAYTLGQGRWRVLTRIVIPMARPAIAAGILLAAMETLADFGTVQFFGVQTFTTGIVRTYYGFGDPVGAAQLSTLLLGCVFFLVVFEKASRVRFGITQTDFAG